MKRTPVFEKDGMEFVVPYPEFVGQDEEEAKQIGWGAMLVECIIWKAEFKTKTIPVIGLKGKKARLGNIEVIIINKQLEEDFE